MIFLISSFSLISGKHFIMYSRGDRSSSSCSVRCCNIKHTGDSKYTFFGKSLIRCVASVNPRCGTCVLPGDICQSWRENVCGSCRRWVGAAQRKELNTLKTAAGHCAIEGDKRCTYLSHQQLQQCGLPCSIGSHQSHSCIQVYTKLQVFIYVRLWETLKRWVRPRDVRPCFSSVRAAIWTILTVLSLYLKLTFWTMITGGGIFPQGGK